VHMSLIELDFWSSNLDFENREAERRYLLFLIVGQLALLSDIADLVHHNSLPQMFIMRLLYCLQN